jgi:hypothetical protein
MRPFSAPLQKFNPHQPRDDRGRWTDGTGTVHTNDAGVAITALTGGHSVELQHKRTVSIVLDQLAKIVAEAKRLGVQAPTYNLCKITVPGTNIFCADNKGLPRAKMPQLKGVPTPGTRADEMPRDVRGEVDLNNEFRMHLISKGVQVIDERVPAARLKPTQMELNGEKVAGIAQAYERGDLAKERLFAAQNYILDGHHRWAGILGTDLQDNITGDHFMEIAQVQMPILDLVQEANSFAAEWGIPQADLSGGFSPTMKAAALDWSDLDEVFKYDPNQARDERGRWTAGGSSGPTGAQETIGHMVGARGGDPHGVGVVESNDTRTPEQRHDDAWDNRETYEPDAKAAAVAANYRAEQGLPQPHYGRNGLLGQRASLGRARQVVAIVKTSDTSAIDLQERVAYNDLIRQTGQQLAAMKRAGVKVEYLSPREIIDRGLDPAGLNPYPTAKAQRDDVAKNGRLMIASIADYPSAYHPILDSSRGGAYDQFRAVHDYFGHVAAGTGFDRHGEFQAWLNHTSMFTGDARQAASSELHVENSYLAVEGTSAPHFATLLPDDMVNPFTDDGVYKGIGWLTGLAEDG